MVNSVKKAAQLPLNTTTAEGKDAIQQECKELQTDLDNLYAFSKEHKKSLEKCLETWVEFEKYYEDINSKIQQYDIQLKKEAFDPESATVQDMDRCKVVLIYDLCL